MLNEEKQIKCSKYLLGTFIVVAGIVIASYLFSRAGIRDNGNRAGDVRTKLEQAIGDQQTISSGITDSKGTADAIGSSIERSQAANRSAAEAVDRCTELVEETRKLTERNLEILATIRTRGTTGDRSQD